MDSVFLTSAPDLNIVGIETTILIPSNEKELEDRYGCDMNYVWVTFTRAESIKVQNKIRAAWRNQPPKDDKEAQVVAQKVCDEHKVEVRMTRAEKVKSLGFDEEALSKLREAGLL